LKHPIIPTFQHSIIPFQSYSSVCSRPAAAGPRGGLTYNFKSSEPQNPQKAQKNIIRVVRVIRMLKVIPLFIAALSLTLIALASKP
jgi:hypothetical protein